MGTFIKSNFVSSDTLAPRVTPIYALDTFNRADNTTTAGTTEFGGYTWSVSDGGTASILGNQLNLVKGTLATSVARIDDGRADGVLTAKMGKLAALSGLYFRGTAATNTGYVLYTNGSSYEFKTKTGDDAYGAAITLSPAPVAAVGDVLQVTMSGSTITVKINGTTYATVTNTAYTGTTKGFFVRNTTGVFDDFKWEPLP